MSPRTAASVDPVTGIARNLGVDSSCPLSGAGPGGLAVCFHTAAATTGAAGDDELRVLRGAAVQAYKLSGSTIGGDACVDAAGTTLAGLICGLATLGGGCGCSQQALNQCSATAQAPKERCRPE